jgi:GntR family transcriptional regulator, transcriptional activator for L-galactonate catabolism
LFFNDNKQLGSASQVQNMTELAQQCFNALCKDWREQHVDVVPSESQMALQCGCSRTVIREVLGDMAQKGIIELVGRRKKLLRLPSPQDFLETSEEVKSKAEVVVDQLMQTFRTGQYKAGESFSELELSRQFKTTTGTVREALLKIEQYQFIHKQARQRWQVVQCRGTHLDQALEFRRIIERISLEHFCRLPKNSVHWKDLDNIKLQHQNYILNNNISIGDWLSLDDAFHHLIVKASENEYMTRSIKGLSLLISLQFQHLSNFPTSILKSAQHHLAMIEALENNQPEICLILFDAHLELAKERLLNK